MTADIFTKPLPRPQFEKHVLGLGLGPGPSTETEAGQEAGGKNCAGMIPAVWVCLKSPAITPLTWEHDRSKHHSYSVYCCALVSFVTHYKSEEEEVLSLVCMLARRIRINDRERSESIAEDISERRARGNGILFVVGWISERHCERRSSLYLLYNPTLPHGR